MAKKNNKTARLVSDSRPTAANVDFPVFVPNSKGETTIDVGKARLRHGTLVIELKDTGSSVAIQNMIERGALLGLGFILLQADVVNEMYQDVVHNEALDVKARDLAIAEGALIHDKELGTISVPAEVDRTIGDIIAEYKVKVEENESGELDGLQRD